MIPRLMSWRREDLAYCSNVHPAESVDAVQTVLNGFVGRVRMGRRLDSMGSGLWLSGAVASSLQDQRRLADFSRRLDDCGVELFTLNGFPYGNFHGESVKEKVYQPDWSEPARLAYTLDLAEVLAACLAENRKEGTISTVPLGYRPAWSGEKQQVAARNLCRLAVALDELRRRTGRSVRVCLEMEPGCVLETTREAIDFFRGDLSRTARELVIPPDVLARHLGVCFDICHQAVMFEDVGQSLRDLREAAITVGKLQISSALEVGLPGEQEILAELRRFAEPRYLHQVRTRREGVLQGAADLPEALANDSLPVAGVWRVHFHVPIQAESLEHPALTTTRGSIQRALDFLKNEPACRPHLEVETYTWQVLPASLRPRTDQELIKGIMAELDWLEHELDQRGLLNGTYS